MDDTRIWFGDSEVFAHDVMWVFKNKITHEYKMYHNDSVGLCEFLQSYDPIICGFNFRDYDQYILKGCLAGWSPEQIKIVNDTIINSHDLRTVWSMFDGVWIDMPPVIDLIHDIVPRRSLKEIAANLGLNIEESSVPFDIKTALTQDEIAETFHYCKNDVDVTEALYYERTDYLASKILLCQMNDIDETTMLQNTNARVISEVFHGRRREYVNEQYEIPENIRIENIPDSAYYYAMNIETDVLDFLCPPNKDDDDSGSKKIMFDFFGCPTVMGLGGAHAACGHFDSSVLKSGKNKGRLTKKCVFDPIIEHSTDERVILIQDVGSFYPSMIINNGYMSRAAEDAYDKFTGFYNLRMKAKAEGNKQNANAAKLVLNTTYGASKARTNKLYDPMQGTRICISGQLYIFDVITRIHKGCPSAHLIQINTDGWVLSVKRSELDKMQEIVDTWSQEVNLTLESDEVRTIIQRDVNNYIMEFEEKDDEGNYKVKVKGATVKGFNGSAFDFNSNVIVGEAIVKELLYGIPITETINNCTDMSKFQIVTKHGSSFSGSCIGTQLVNTETVFNSSGKPIMYDDYAPLTLVNKVNRIYAGKKPYGTGYPIYKIKRNPRVMYDSEGNKIDNLGFYRFPDTPDNVLIDDENVISNDLLLQEVDKLWYIDLAEKKRDKFIEGIDMAENDASEVSEKQAPVRRKSKTTEDKIDASMQRTAETIHDKLLELHSCMFEITRGVPFDKVVSFGGTDVAYLDTQQYKTLLESAALKCGLTYSCSTPEPVNFLGKIGETHSGNPQFGAMVTLEHMFEYNGDRVMMFSSGFGMGTNGNFVSIAYTNAMRNFITNNFLVDTTEREDDVAANSVDINKSYVSERAKGEIKAQLLSDTAESAKYASVKFGEVIYAKLTEAINTDGVDSAFVSKAQHFVDAKYTDGEPTTNSDGTWIVEKDNAVALLTEIDSVMRSVESE